MDAAAVGSAVVNNSAASRSAKSLADTFDTFLTLLTKQLQNQDPLEPVDSSEFTQQLVLFTSAEQAVATNKNLEALISLSTATQTVGAVSYIGKTIQAEGKTSTLANGAANWNYTLPSNANTTLVTITDASGKVMFNGQAETAAGTHRFVWDGRNNQGASQPDGSYTISISAKNARGEPITANTSIVGRVDSVEMVDGGIVLAIGTTKVPFDKVQVVKETPAAEQPSQTNS